MVHRAIHFHRILGTGQDKTRGIWIPKSHLLQLHQPWNEHLFRKNIVRTAQRMSSSHYRGCLQHSNSKWMACHKIQAPQSPWAFRRQQETGKPLADLKQRSAIEDKVEKRKSWNTQSHHASCKTSTLGVGRAELGLLKELVSKVPWESAFAGILGFRNAGRFVRAISYECRSKQFQSVKVKQARQKASLAEQGSSSRT